jgi:hypothetical protein
VVHDVDRRRFTLGYLTRRAYWQGRSEVRRGQPVAGLRKEWRRYRRPGLATLLAPGYLLAFAVGIGHEKLLELRRRRVTIESTVDNPQGPEAEEPCASPSST